MKRELIYFLFAAIFASSAPCLGDSSLAQGSDSENSPSKSESVTPLIENISSLQQYLDWAPENSRKALGHFAEMIGLNKYSSDGEVAGSNRGLISYFEEQTKNPCIQNHIENFYREIKNAQAEADKNYATQIKLGSRINGGRNPKLKPGWVWNLALKSAAGDPNTAMFLIGYCGHDDALENPICPGRTSSFYMPGSLDTKADLDPELIKKLWKVQGNGSATNNKIPAKYYHVYGGAFTACEMIRFGLNPILAKMTVGLAAVGYRGLRLCNNFAQGTKIERIMSSEKLNYNNAEDFIKGLNSNPNFKFKVVKAANIINMADIEEIDDLEEPLQLTPEQEQILKLYIKTQFVQIDAKTLYQNWYLGGEKGRLQNLPCTDIRLFGPVDLLKPREQFRIGLEGKPSGWSEPRYRKALHVLATWDADFEFTKAQHEAGAEFAKQVCKPSKKPLFADQCPDSLIKMDAVANIKSPAQEEWNDSKEDTSSSKRVKEAR